MLPRRTKVYIQNNDPSPLGGISLAGVVRRGIGVPIPTRILRRYSLVYLFDGEGFYTDNQVTDLPVQPGSLIQLFPDTPHGYGPRGGLNWHEVYLIFDGPLFDVWAQQGCFDVGQPVTSLKPIAYWRDRFIETIAHNEGESVDQLGEVLRVQELILEIREALSKPAVQDDRSWADQAKQALSSEATPQLAAHRLGVSYETFRKRFSREAGIPPSRFQAMLAMDRACEFLTSTSMSVQDIARELDFCDEFHFSKRFSQIMGCSPTSFRARSYRN